jgi:cobalt/nickel transport system permease protein
MTLFAVHIGNNVLTWRWELGGFALAGVLLVIGAWRLQQDEIPRVALLTAAFFVASSMHVPLGPASVHLLLNGLVGVLLGWRAVPAIFVGLLLQALLMHHGGYTALGVNTSVIAVPAVVACLVFRALNRIPGLTNPLVRALLVAGASALWFLSAVVAVALLVFRWSAEAQPAPAEQALDVLIHPLTLAGALAFASLAAWLERRLENAPEFPLGLFVGVAAVLLTVGLNCGVLIAGGAYFAVAAAEGVVMGFTVGFLAKVKPELLGLRPVSCPIRQS